MSPTPCEPPQRLDEPLELDPSQWRPVDVYYLMTALVVPRPIGWISTVSNEGVYNVAPYSYFNVIAHNPPHVVFSSSGTKDTLRNIRANNQFVVNIVTMDLLEKMNFTATDFPADQDEFAWAELETAPSACVRPPRVAAAKGHLECETVEIVQAGNGRLVIGRVLHVHISPTVWKDGRVAVELLDPVCRLSGSGYARLGEIMRLPRPGWADVEASQGLERMPRLGSAGPA